MKNLFKKISYINREYKCGKFIHYLLADKKGNSVYCDQCGNIANGVAQRKFAFFDYNKPLCKNHMLEAFPGQSFSLPCIKTIV